MPCSEQVRTLVTSSSPALLISPEIAPPGLAGDLLRLHAALNQRELWHALRVLVRNALPSTSVTFEVDRTQEGAAVRTYRHGHPVTPRDAATLPHPAQGWLQQHPGVRAFRLSDIISLRELRLTPYFDRVMRREGWDKQLSIVAWQGKAPHGRLNLFRATGEPDFSPRDERMAAALQPHFETAFNRVLAHEDAVYLGEQVARMLDDAPVGLLLLDWELRPLWHNREGAHACVVWAHGERRAAALSPTRAFRVPAPLLEACTALRQEWALTTGTERERGVRPRVLSDDALGLHAQVTLRTFGTNPLLRPAFDIQLDYRRPRGDRNRPLSPGAVALLGRLSPREREVAMRVREGLGTREIAAELHRSPLTIKTQLAAIFRKLEVRSRTRVAALLNR
jgi:DNA-binding CsgD family transcriptional regulator